MASGSLGGIMPIVDFSPLAELPDVMRAASDREMLRRALANVDLSSSEGIEKAARSLISTGDPKSVQLGAGLLGEANKRRDIELGQSNDAFIQRSLLGGPVQAGNPLDPRNMPGLQKRAEPYAPIIQQSAQQYGVSPDLLTRQIDAESSFDPFSRSNKGAIGISQFIPSTARQEGVNPFDPNSSISGQARYMSKLTNKFGNEGLALAAYNWGEGAVNNWLARGANGPVPKETKDYVMKITGRDLRDWALGGRNMRYEGLNQAPVQTAQAGPMAQTGGPQLQAPNAIQQVGDVSDFSSQVGQVLGRNNQEINRTLGFLSMSRLSPGLKEGLKTVLASQLDQMKAGEKQKDWMMLNADRLIRGQPTTSFEDYMKTFHGRETSEERVSAAVEQHKQIANYDSMKKIGNEAFDQADRASANRINIGRLHQIATDAAFASGPGLEKAQQVMGFAIGSQDFLKNYGIEIKSDVLDKARQQLSLIEQFSSLSNEGVYKILGGVGNQVSNKDVDFVQRVYANMKNSKTGNLRILEFQDFVESLKEERAKVVGGYMQQKGATHEGLRDLMQNFDRSARDRIRDFATKADEQERALTASRRPMDMGQVAVPTGLERTAPRDVVQQAGIPIGAAPNVPAGAQPQTRPQTNQGKPIFDRNGVEHRMQPDGTITDMQGRPKFKYRDGQLVPVEGL